MLVIQKAANVYKYPYGTLIGFFTDKLVSSSFHYISNKVIHNMVSRYTISCEREIVIIADRCLR